MNLRRIVLLLLVIVFIALLRPSAIPIELRRIWMRRNLILGTLAVSICIYLLYGLFVLYSEGRLAW